MAANSPSRSPGQPIDDKLEDTNSSTPTPAAPRREPDMHKTDRDHTDEEYHRQLGHGRKSRAEDDPNAGGGQP
ncbi:MULTISPECIES: hypothetical protein [unclassified Pigmentiphaga]|uniref:hypothetical protein n=1 Tax=unclassified Pigmentiphaga TaxID=2626614 RepID=UPI000B413962|nr:MULTISPECIES: hypothetical protein [unclassified Pigmentiphaga]MBX6318761.1 hypothetical protein [Pigmentiphaga sp.]OVZ64284.1 hypothetical protein CDO44_02635 [Pigmentiphaga sp. NML080357]